MDNITVHDENKDKEQVKKNQDHLIYYQMYG